MRPLQASQDEIHQPLESCGSVTKSERHDPELKKALSSAESRLLTIGLLYLDLPVPSEKVQRTELFRTCKCV